MTSVPQGRPCELPIDQLTQFLAKFDEDLPMDPSSDPKLFAELSGLIPSWLDDIKSVLASSFDERDHETVGRFTLRLVEIVAFILRSREPLHRIRGASTLLRRIFLCDPNCNYFIRKSGKVEQRSREATDVNGDHAYVPPGGASKYHIANLNRFGDLSGFESIIRRLEETAELCDGEPEAADTASDVGLFVQIVFESRFVISRKWNFSVWPRFHPPIFTFVNRVGTPTYPKNRELTRMLFRLDTIGRALAGIYQARWDWSKNSDIVVSYNLQHCLTLLANEEPSNVVKGAAFIGQTTNWALKQLYLLKLEPVALIKDWLLNNSIKEALEAAVGDSFLSPDQQDAIKSAIRDVTAFHSKVPSRSITELPRRPITLYLKTSYSRPSFGSLYLDLNGVVTTVGEIFLRAAELLGHPVEKLRLETQAGKQVLYAEHNDWAISSITQACILNVYIRSSVDSPGGFPSDAGASAAVPSDSPYSPTHPSMRSTSEEFSYIHHVGTRDGTPDPSDLNDYLGAHGLPPTEASIRRALGESSASVDDPSAVVIGRDSGSGSGSSAGAGAGAGGPGGSSRGHSAPRGTNGHHHTAATSRRDR